ncbi:mucin-2-like [Ixodes scapularis]|uniref:mucin-2-like n=1 Tax=Ixodes scapularis TaxID=6945 RepID=UPI001AD7CA1F|nr:mucin-2-like [Ixodes scapularis]
MGSPWHLLALLLLPTSLAPTLHHRAYAVAVPPITEGALAPPVGGVTGRASTNDAPNATEELEALKHHGVDRTAAWDALELGGAESTATPDRPDLGQGSLKDARGPAALGNVFAGTPRESGEAVAVAEDDARNGTGARLTARLSLNGPRLSTLRGEESPSESLETFLVATSPSPEEDAFSPVTMSGDSSQDQVRNTDAPTRAVTSLDDSVLEEGVSRTTAFPEEAWVSDISPTLNTTEGVVAPNLPSSRESERASEAPPPNLKEAMTLPERNGSRDSSPTDIPETTTDLPILLGENASIIEVQLTNPAKTHISPQNSTELVAQTTGNYLELDRMLYQTTDIPETTTDLPVLLGGNASIIEVQLTNPAKTHISLQNSTELVAQTTETPEKYLEQDRTLYRTTNIPETTTDLPILLGENASIIEVQLNNPAKTHISPQNSTEVVAQTTETPEKYLEQDRTLYRTTDIPETTTDLPILLGENASIIEVQLTNPAKTHISPQNSTEVVAQTTETPEKYLEQDRTLYRTTNIPETTTDLPIPLGENASIIEVQLTNPAKTHISPQNSTEVVAQTTETPEEYLEQDRTLYRTTDIPETTTDLPILLGENASIIEVQLTNPAKTHISPQNSTEVVAQTTETPEKYLEQDRTLYRTTDIPETTTDLPILLGENASIIEVQLTNPAKTHISPQNSTELVAQTTDTPENYLEQDRTLYRVTEASKQTSSGVLQEEHLELPTASSTPLGIKNPHGLLALLTTQASATTASSIVHNTKEPVVLLGLPTTTSTLGSVLTNLAQDVHPHWPNISDSFPGNAGAAEVRPLETASPEVLDVWTEDSGNGSRRRPADTSTEEPYGVSEPQAPPATSSSGEVTTARRVTDQEEGAFANASVPIATSVEVEASAPPNGTFALEEDGLWVHLVSTQTATGPAVDRTEERQLPVTTTPAESFVEDSEVLSPAKSTTSLESAAVGDDALTTIPARDLDAVETPSATQTDFTEDAAPTNRPDTVGLTTQLPASTPPCVPLEPPRGLTHEFRLVFRTASEFSWERVEALERRIQDFLRDGPCPRRFARTAFALGPPHVLSWTDPSANATWCDHASVEALLRTMRSESGRPTPAITRAFYPEFLISSVELQLRGACASEAGAFPIVAAVVGAALSAALLAGLLAVLCRYLRPRSRRLDVTPAGDSFDLKQRRPVLLPGEGGRASADGTPRKAPRAPFVVDTDFCYINPNFLEVARPSPPAPPYRPEPPPHGPRSAPGGPDDLASSSSGVESDPSAGEAADAS